MKKIEELKKEMDLNLGEFGQYLCDYDNGYICDIISKIANNNVDVYYDDLFDWAKNDKGYIEDALNVFGTPKNDKGEADFIKMIQQGQYYYNEQDLYNNLKDSLLNYVLNYIINDLNITELTEEQEEQLMQIDYEDNNARLEDLTDDVYSIFFED